MPNVEINGQVVAFPDSLSPDQLQAAVSAAAGQMPRSGPAPSMIESVAHGVADPIHGGAQLLTHSLPGGVVDAVNDATRYVNELPVVGPVTRALGMTPATPAQIDETVRTREADYQARRGPEAGTDWGRYAGKIAAGIPVALATRNPQSLIGSVGVGATQGAALSALDPVVAAGDYWSNKGEQVATGAAVGGAAGPVGYAIGRAIAPRVSDAVRTLDDAGVQMTPGQMIGGGVRRVEEAAASIPLVGDQIRAAQRTGVESFNRAAANRVLKPLGHRVPNSVPAGRDLVQHVAQRVGQAYDDVLPSVKPFDVDPRLVLDVRRAANQITDPTLQDRFISIITNKVGGRARGPIDGQTYQAIKSELGTLATNFRTSSLASERELGEALFDAQAAFQALLARTNPQVRAALTRADKAYEAFIRFQTAASNPAAVDGVFTPSMLNSAVRQTDRSLRHSAYARGTAPLQEFSDAAKDVLPRTVPDSGTPYRAMVAGALLGGAGGAQIGVPLTGAAAGAGLTAAYSPMMQRWIQAAIASGRPEALRAVGDMIARSGGLVSAPAVGTP